MECLCLRHFKTELGAAVELLQLTLFSVLLLDAVWIWFCFSVHYLGNVVAHQEVAD